MKMFLAVLLLSASVASAQPRPGPESWFVDVTVADTVTVEGDPAGAVGTVVYKVFRRHSLSNDKLVAVDLAKDISTNGVAVPEYNIYHPTLPVWYFPSSKVVRVKIDRYYE
jgi:hypothetical protein